MAKGPYKPKSVDANPLTKAQKLRQFWNYNLNPITGYYDAYNAHQTGSGFIESVSLPNKIPTNKYSN